MIEFKKKSGGVILQYSSESGNEWVYEKLNNNEAVNLKSVKDHGISPL